MPPPSPSAPSPPRPQPPRKLALAAATLGTIQILIALTVAAIVQLRLRGPLGACLLGSSASENAVVVGGRDGFSYARNGSCSFAYTVCAASIFASFALSLVRCLGVRVGFWLEGATAAGLSGWWAVAAAVFSYDSSRASSLPEGGARGAVVALAWVEAVVFAALAVIYSKVNRWLVANAAAGPAAGDGGVVELGGVPQQQQRPPADPYAFYQQPQPQAQQQQQQPPVGYSFGGFSASPGGLSQQQATPPTLPPQQHQPAAAAAAPAPAPPPPPPVPAIPPPPPSGSGNPFAPK